MIMAPLNYHFVHIAHLFVILHFIFFNKCSLSQAKEVDTDPREMTRPLTMLEKVLYSDLVIPQPLFP